MSQPFGAAGRPSLKTVRPVPASPDGVRRRSDSSSSRLEYSVHAPQSAAAEGRGRRTISRQAYGAAISPPASAAVRAENYSDFGSNVSGKLSARYDFTKQFALRSSASTGFRAPTPGQTNTSSIATTFNPGNPNAIEFMTLPVAILFLLLMTGVTRILSESGFRVTGCRNGA